MADKAIIKHPKDLEAVINRGGASAASQGERPETERVFNLRVPAWLVAQVDALRKKRAGKISRNTWILEAMEDKLERELEGRGGTPSSR